MSKENIHDFRGIVQSISLTNAMLSMQQSVKKSPEVADNVEVAAPAITGPVVEVTVPVHNLVPRPIQSEEHQLTREALDNIREQDEA